VVEHPGAAPAARFPAHLVAAQGVPRIRASTDLDNVPMAQAFSRAGWENFERAITMTWS
jgi:hypothetical protein